MLVSFVYSQWDSYGTYNLTCIIEALFVEFRRSISKDSKYEYTGGPGVDSTSNRNEYQVYFLGVKAAGS